MANSADFELRLKNRIAAPAKAASEAIGGVGTSFRELGATAARAAKQAERAVAQQAAAAVKAEREQSRASSQAAKQIERKAATEAAAQRRLAQAQSQANRRADRERERQNAAAIREANQRAKAEVRASAEVVKAQQREAREIAKARKAADGKARSDAAFLAHKKVLSGDMGDEISQGLIGRLGLGSLVGGAGVATATVATAGLALVAAAALGVAVAAGKAAIAVGGLGVSFAMATLEAGDFSASSRLMLGRLAGDATVGSKAFDEIRQQAQELGLDIRESVGQAEKLVGAGLEVNLAKSVIASGADLGTGNALAEVIERIADAGELGTRDLKALQRAGIAQTNVFARLSEATGKSREELEKLIAAGQIKPDVAIAAVLSAAGREVNAANPGDVAKARVASTFAGMQRQIGAAWENFLINVGDKALPVLAPIASKVSQALMRGLENPRLQAAGQRLLGGIERFGTWVIAHMPQIESAVAGAFEGIGSAIETVANVFEFFEEHPNHLKAGLIALGAAAAVVGGALTAVVATAAIMAAPFVGLALAIGGVVVAVQNAINSITELWPRFVDAGKNIVAGLISGITAGATALLGTVGGLAGSVASVFSGPQGIDAASPSKLFKGFGQDTTAGYVAGLKSGRSDVGAAIAQVVPFAANDNVFASRAAPAAVPGVAAPITPLSSASGALQSSSAGKPSVNISGLVVNIHTQATDAPGIVKEATGGIERELKRVLSGL